MKKQTYDIFISYRRVGGAQYARILQLMLIQRGYKVFLDYDELTDGVFSDKIRAAIKEAPVFILVLSGGSMARCANEGDWVREEITLAVEQRKHIIPVNPDNSFDGFPDGMPEKLKEAIGSHQHSEISFGQALGATIDLLIKNRLTPTLGERTSKEHVDIDFKNAQESLRKQDSHNRFIKLATLVGIAVVVLISLVTCLLFWHHQKADAESSTLRKELHEKHSTVGLNMAPNLTVQQMCAIDTLLSNMIAVRPDTLWMCKYEFPCGWWHRLKGEKIDPLTANLPVTNVSFAEISMFLGDLYDMTGIMFSLPSVDDWQYAAHGGQYNETTIYAGDSVADKVAWYNGNSGGCIHPSDGQQGLWPNYLDLYDMSGNVGELCNSTFVNGEDNAPLTVCGGDYTSSVQEVTIASMKPQDADEGGETVGFRISIKK